MKPRTIEHYELLRKLGAGGSGVVYYANDTLLMRPVVIKLLKRGALTVEQMRRTVLREARMASAIEHPNVCAIYEVGEEGDEAYIVMQYVPGQPLDKLIERGPSTPELVLSVGIQIADGLSAAHSLGIFHRDLKPANVMLTDGGLAKILDFGLARRLNPEDAEFDPAKSGPLPAPAAPAAYTVRGGTIAYMAPEQFVTGQSSVQSDLWALGVILYELASARHPFTRPEREEIQNIRAIQFADPQPLNVPDGLNSAIFRLLEKNPAERYAGAADAREALKTAMSAMGYEAGGAQRGFATIPPPSTAGEAGKRATGLLSMLAERFREPESQGHEDTLMVLPFQDLGASRMAPLYGLALADAIATRIARMSSLVVRPSSALMNMPVAEMDPLAVGHKLMVRWLLAGNFLRSEKGFDLNWQLLDVPGESVRGGGTISVPAFDLVTIQAEICDEVFASLQGLGRLGRYPERGVVRRDPLAGDLSEDYLQGRAMLAAFMQRTGSRIELDRARKLFERVLEGDANFAPAWIGLGIAQLQYVQHGLGGRTYIIAARKALDRALTLDPGSVEANLYRVYMLLSRGEKESARHGIEHLLHTAANDANVHAVAGVTLRLDGMYEDALKQFSLALRLNPSNAPILYNHRARVYQYLNQMELAEDELAKGLALEPKHPLLQTSTAYQRMRLGHLPEAIRLLEEVISNDSGMKIAYPTLAMCYAQMGDRKRATALIQEDSMAAAEADSEMAYRLATYFAVDGDEGEALHWLRRAIYLGNENYPWFSINPAWGRVRGHDDFERMMDDLKRSFQRNQKNWRRLLDGV